ncbi:hypothetical protein KY313_03215 [Candidatus Woesearchaeota archaeon]|jgi:hypothetical protein|nr:hypothetical protein [Candidatus Woesearchaeota archaeon]
MNDTETKSQLQKLNLYLAPNETRFSNIMDEVEKKYSDLEDTVFFGVIGGVDLSLGYLLVSNASKGFLFDKNPQALDYLSQRLNLAQETDTPQEYLAKLGERNKKAHKKLSVYMNLLENKYPKEFDKLWLNDQGKFDKIKRLNKEEKIKSFTDDYYGEGAHFINTLIDGENAKNALVYLSNIAEWEYKGKEPELFKSRNKVLRDKLDNLNTAAIIESSLQGNNYISGASWVPEDNSYLKSVAID